MLTQPFFETVSPLTTENSYFIVNRRPSARLREIFAMDDDVDRMRVLARVVGGVSNDGTTLIRPVTRVERGDEIWLRVNDYRTPWVGLFIRSRKPAPRRTQFCVFLDWAGLEHEMPAAATAEGEGRAAA